ncbi:MAG: UDP-N-acetylmuramoyl-L-alanine--D-glutamate ligase, partial [Chloroflexota bacterium]
MANDPLHGKNVVIVGFARQGQALARWLPTLGAEVTVTDGKSAEALGINTADYPGVDFVMEEHPDSLLDSADVLCVSGGVPLTIPFIQAAVERGISLSN